MAYRRAAVREEQVEESARATFRVRHRSWVGLAFAGITVASAIAYWVMYSAAPSGQGLVMLALILPAMLLAFAFALSVPSAAEVDLGVTPTADKQAVLVTLRRRWSFLPWTAPLVFTARRTPTLVTHWETGRFSSKYGRGREYKRVSLALKVGETEIVLPTMRASRTHVADGIVVIDHAPAVLQAMKRYDEGVVAVREELGRAQVDRRETRKRTGVPTAQKERPRLDEDPSSRILVASSEGAFGWAAAIGVAAGIVVPAALALAAYLLPHSTTMLVCGGLVMPIFGWVIGLVAAAASHGQTLYFQKKCAEYTSVTTVHDLFLFGPLLQGKGDAAHALEPNFRFHVKKVIADEDSNERYVLVAASTGRALRSDSDERVVRRYGERLGGREIAATASARVS